MQDPLADMFTVIRNAQQVGKPSVLVRESKLKKAVCAVLHEEGYIQAVESVARDGRQMLDIELAYHDGRPVIKMLKRVSRPGLRNYVPCTELPKVYNGLGIAVVSTNKGVMSDRGARRRQLGGEVLCLAF